MSDSGDSLEIVLARWSDRFFAWLIDFLIITSISLIFMASTVGMMNIEWNETMMFSREMNFLPESIVFFAYWVILEYEFGTSIGKRILHLKVVDLNGKRPKLIYVILSSFGKSFLLPIDMIFGLIFTNQKRQRIFQKISNTVVIKIKENEKELEKITYKKD